jgi:hypothetical protein
MWGTIITVGLQVLGWFIARSNASEETKKQYFEFVKRAGTDFSSTRLTEYGDKQLQWLKDNPWVETK